MKILAKGFIGYPACRHPAWLLILILGAASTHAQTLDEQYEYFLQTAPQFDSSKCTHLNLDRDAGTGELAPGQVGPNLFAFCNGFPDVSTGVGTTAVAASGGGAGVAATRNNAEEDEALRRRRERARKENRNATNTADKNNNDIELAQFGATSIFSSVDYHREKQDVTHYEDGRKANRYAFTVGVDHRFAHALLAGFAAKAESLLGDFASGGNFATHAAGATFYSSWLPIDGLFVDATLGVDYKKLDSTRIVGRTVVFTPLGGGDPTIYFSPAYAPVYGDTHGRALNAELSSGYDLYRGRFTIGPRANMMFTNSNIDNYAETGASPMSLAFDNQTEVSLQSAVGVQASAAYTLGGSVIVPQLNASWVHEYRDDQHTLTAHFAEDLRANPTVLTFLNQPPDRDVYNVRFSSVIVGKNGISGFIAFEKLFGHAYRDAYGASLGIRWEL